VANKIEKAAASGTYNQIKTFLGANGLSGSVANTIGGRISGGKASSEWTTDEAVLKQVLAALKAGEVE
jgi:hypothetical protein